MPLSLPSSRAGEALATPAIAADPVALVEEMSGAPEDIARTCHGHPTLNEAVQEAALGVAGRAIHI